MNRSVITLFLFLLSSPDFASVAFFILNFHFEVHFLLSPKETKSFLLNPAIFRNVRECHIFWSLTKHATLQLVFKILNIETDPFA